MILIFLSTALGGFLAEVEKAETMEDLLQQSDYVSLHVPLVEATKNLINASQS